MLYTNNNRSVHADRCWWNKFVPCVKCWMCILACDVTQTWPQYSSGAFAVDSSNSFQVGVTVGCIPSYHPFIVNSLHTPGARYLHTARLEKKKIYKKIVCTFWKEKNIQEGLRGHIDTSMRFLILPSSEQNLTKVQCDPSTFKLTNKNNKWKSAFNGRISFQREIKTARCTVHSTNYACGRASIRGCVPYTDVEVTHEVFSRTHDDMSLTD
jgi:hypothetical protein